MPTVYDDITGQSIRYDDQSSVGDGSTATVFQSQTDSNQVLKIFTHPTAEDETRIDEQLSRPVPHPAASWPIRKLADQNGHFVGYSMLKMPGIPVQCFVSSAIRAKRQLNWDHWNRLTVSIETLKILRELSNCMLLLQDLNLGNVLVVTNTDGVVTNVSIIDVPDSVQYQLRDQHCNLVTRTPPYLADEMVPPEYYDVDVQQERMTIEGVNFIAFCFVHFCLKGISPFDYDCPSLTYEERAKQGLYPFGPKKLPSDATIQDVGIPWDEFTQDLKANCIKAATEKGPRRPTLEKWISVLTAARSRYQPIVTPPAVVVPANGAIPLGQSIHSHINDVQDYFAREPFRWVAVAVVACYFLISALLVELNQKSNSAEPPFPRKKKSRNQQPMPVSVKQSPPPTGRFDLGSDEWREALRGTP